MPIRWGSVFLVWLWSTGWACADQVTLRNGDRVTGTIVKKEADMLTVESVHFGTITMPWTEVDALTTDAAMYVELAGEIVPGTVSASGGQVQIAAASGTRSVSMAELVSIRNNAEQQAYERLLDPGWMELWAGGFNLGWAGTAGNAQTQTFTFAANAARPTNTDRTSMYFNAVRASALVSGVKESTARAVRGGWAYDRDIKARFFWQVFNDYEYDRFQSLDLRFVLGAGAGFHLIESERTRLDVQAGSAYNRERFSTPLTRNSSEFYWGNELHHEMNSRITLLQAYRMFNSLTETPDFRVNLDLGVTLRLAQWLTWNVNASDRYLHNPVAGRKRNDVLYSTGLGLTFGR